MSADSLQAMFTTIRNGMKSMEVKMNDWESVISKDKKKNRLGFGTGKNGKITKENKDSMDLIDDLKIKDGNL